MRRWEGLAILGMTLLAVFMHLLPLFQYQVWGSDLGEYFLLTQRLSANNALSLQYDGWGLAYPYFPSMFMLNDMMVKLGGIELFSATVLVTPIVSALVVLPVYLITKRITSNAKASLFAGLFLATIMAHVYSNSHPMPGSLASVLGVTCILFFLGAPKQRKFFILTIVVFGALVLTHHLTSYFVFISVGFMLFTKEMLFPYKDRSTLRMHLATLYCSLSLMMFYWLVLAPPFSKQIITMGFGIPAVAVVALAFGALTLMGLVIRLRQRVSWRYEPKRKPVGRMLARYIVFVIIAYAITCSSSFISVPGTNIVISTNVFYLIVPLLLILGFVAVGPTFLRLYGDGVLVYAWVGAIGFSGFYGFITKSEVFLLYRHIPYAMEAGAAIVGIGYVGLFQALALYLKQRAKTEGSSVTEDGDEDENRNDVYVDRLRDRITGARRVKIIAVLYALVLLGTNMAIAYPPQDILGGFEEGTLKREMRSVLWARGAVSNDALLASDHRMSSMVFGFAEVDTTWDYAANTLKGHSFAAAKEEMLNCSSPSGKRVVDYVLVTDKVAEGVALLQWETAEPLDNAALEKFDRAPFRTLFRDQTSAVYFVDWDEAGEDQ